jgi:hypothetical protein
MHSYHQAEVKAGEDARHQVVLDLKERQLKLEKIKNKYETVAAKLRAQNGLSSDPLDGGGGDDQERSQAYYIISSAQQVCLF